MPPTASTRLLTTHSYAQSKPGRIGYCNLDCNTPQTLTRHNTERKLTQQATCRRSYSSVLHCHTHTMVLSITTSHRNGWQAGCGGRGAPSSTAPRPGSSHRTKSGERWLPRGVARLCEGGRHGRRSLVIYNSLCIPIRILNSHLTNVITFCG